LEHGEFERGAFRAHLLQELGCPGCRIAGLLVIRDDRDPHPVISAKNIRAGVADSVAFAQVPGEGNQLLIPAVVAR